MGLNSRDIYQPVVQGTLRKMAQSIREEPELHTQTQELTITFSDATKGYSNFAALCALAVVFETILNQSVAWTGNQGEDETQ